MAGRAQRVQEGLLKTGLLNWPLISQDNEASEGRELVALHARYPFIHYVLTSPCCRRLSAAAGEQITSPHFSHTRQTPYVSHLIKTSLVLYLVNMAPFIHDSEKLARLVVVGIQQRR